MEAGEEANIFTFGKMENSGVVLGGAGNPQNDKGTKLWVFANNLENTGELLSRADASIFLGKTGDFKAGGTASANGMLNLYTPGNILNAGHL